MYLSDSLAIVAVVAAVAALALQGCGNTALLLNAEVARGMLEIQATSGPAIRRFRVQAGITAGGEAQAHGATEQQAQRAALVAANRWQCAIDGHGIFAGAVTSYIATLALWQAGQDFELTQLLPYVFRAIDAYRFLRSCLTSLGNDTLLETPSFMRLIPSSWSFAMVLDRDRRQEQRNGNGGSDANE